MPVVPNEVEEPSEGWGVPGLHLGRLRLCGAWRLSGLGDVAGDAVPGDGLAECAADDRVDVADGAGGQTARLAVASAMVEELGVEAVEDPGVELLETDAADAGAALAVASTIAVSVVLLVTRIHVAELADSDELSSGYRSLQLLGTALVGVPAFIGAFWGAPLVARELEAGTHRLAWTQSVTRRRWLATKLAIAGAIAVVVSGVFSLLFTWWSLPFDRLGNRIGTANFGQRGIAPIAYALFALVLGTLLGTVIRRTQPAMAATLAGFFVVNTPQHLPVESSSPPSRTQYVQVSVGARLVIRADFYRTSTGGVGYGLPAALYPTRLQRATHPAVGEVVTPEVVSLLQRSRGECKRRAANVGRRTAGHLHGRSPLEQDRSIQP